MAKKERETHKVDLFALFSEKTVFDLKLQMGSFIWRLLQQFLYILGAECVHL